MMRPHRAASDLAIALVSLAVIIYQLTLLRVFSFTIWHHYAFMVISVALLGFGVSGTILQLRPRLSENSLWYAGLCSLWFAISSITSIGLVARVPFDPAQIADSPGQLLYLGLFYVILTVPFALAGLTVVLLLEHHAESVNRLYAADLLGAATGAALAVLLMNLISPQGAAMIAAAAACGCAVILLGSRGRGLAFWASGLACAGFVLLTPLAGQLLTIPAGISKGLTRLESQHPNATNLYSEWNAMARVDVLENAGSISWTRNENAGIQPPKQLRVVIDGDAETPIIDFDGNVDGLGFLDHMIPTSAIQALSPERVLVIGSGGGLDVMGALKHGAQHVDAVEINPLIHELVTETFTARNGDLFGRDDVTLHLDEGRSFIGRSTQSYDAILLSLVDTWASTASGAYSLSESYLYTVDAFEDYLSHLEDDGFLTISRWGWTPPREMLRLVTVADAALGRLGVEQTGGHVVLLASGKVGTLIVKRKPFSQDELNRLASVSQRSGFFPIYAPDFEQETVFSQYLNGGNKSAFLAGYEFDVSPVTDDRPFFFQFGRWSNLQLLGSDWREVIFILSGRLVLGAVLIQALFFSVLLLVLPRMGTASRQTGKSGSLTRILGYFLAIGLAFMFVEIALMQSLTLYLGHPLYATALVLGSLLASAGIGSWLSTKFRDSSRMIFWALVGMTLVAAFIYPALYDATFQMSTGARMLLCILSITPIGVLMGMPFPLAIARLSRSETTKGMIGWAWAANGCASVLGPIIAVLVAIDFGLNVVLVLGAVVYLCAGFAFSREW